MRDSDTCSQSYGQNTETHQIRQKLLSVFALICTSWYLNAIKVPSDSSTSSDSDPPTSIMLSLLDPIMSFSNLQLNPIRELQELCQSCKWDLQFPATKKDGNYLIEANVEGKDVCKTAFGSSLNRGDAIRIAAQRMFTKLKVIVEIEDALEMVVECYGAPQAKRKAAAEHAAEGALWYLKHESYVHKSD